MQPHNNLPGKPWFPILALPPFGLRAVALFTAWELTKGDDREEGGERNNPA